ncbi:MAG: PRC-barrel domain-containing protein [Parvibaculum sp.]
MKRLFTTTALVASMALASAAYAAGDDKKVAPTEITPAEQGSTIDDGATSADAMTTGSLRASAGDVLTIDGDAAVMSETAISARDLIGANVVGPDGKEVGTVNDLVLTDDKTIEQVIVTDGGLLGYGGKQVAIDFDGASVTRDENDDRMVRIGLTDEALEGVAEFDKEPLAETGSELGSSYLGREVALASAEDGSGEVEDLIMDENGTAKYAVIEFGGLFEMGANQVALEIDELALAPAEEPLSLAMTEDQLRQAPKFYYDAEDVSDAGEM